MKRIAIEEHFSTDALMNYLRTKKDYPRLEFVEDEKVTKLSGTSASW